MKKTLLGHYFKFFLITMLILLASYLYMSNMLEKAVLKQVRSDLYQASQVLVPHLPPIDSGTYEADEFCKSTAGHTELRLTIVMRDGLVVGDSENTIRLMDNHADRPEIAQALAGRVGFSSRLSDTMDIRFAYLALPIVEEGKVVAALRLARAIQDIQTTFTSLRRGILALILVIIFTSGLFGFYVSRRTKFALEKLERAARQIHSGNYTISVDIDFPGEAQDLATEMSLMAVQLQRRILEITTQKSELEAILSSMLESVILLGHDLNILRVNNAAARLLQVDREEVKGKSLISVFRNSALHDFAKRVMSSTTPLESNIAYPLQTETLHLQVHGTLIKPRFHKAVTGRIPSLENEDSILLVLNDITRIKNLENIRKDFVANVSHELKTPITSITGFVETLLSGALDEPEEARNFLEIIQRHSNRLDAIIDDLLSLSKLEQPDQGEIVFEETKVSSFISSAVQVCRHKAQQRNITISHSIDPALSVEVIPSLIEQAFVNIIDNAVKYSEADTVIYISAALRDKFVEIKVKDQGHGIPEKDIPRIFERFYRVDKARSREMGGTGLGLSITKHIVRVNKGSIRVASKVGVGTSFYVRLPLRQE